MYWCWPVSGSRADAEAMREEIAVVLSTMGLRLSKEKTLITHIEDGLDFLGWRIQRPRKRGVAHPPGTRDPPMLAQIPAKFALLAA
jgi:RNA-directed DNA polymerase